MEMSSAYGNVTALFKDEIRRLLKRCVYSVVRLYEVLTSYKHRRLLLVFLQNCEQILEKKRRKLPERLTMLVQELSNLFLIMIRRSSTLWKCMSLKGFEFLL